MTVAVRDRRDPGMASEQAVAGPANPGIPGTVFAGDGALGADVSGSGAPERARGRQPLRKVDAVRLPPKPAEADGRPPRIRSASMWTVALVGVVAVHATVLFGVGLLKPEPPPALDTIELTFVAQGDPVPEETKAQEAQQAAMPTPPDPTPPPPDPTPMPPDPTPPPPEPTPQPPPVETPPPPPVEAPPTPPVETPAPPLPVDDPPPPPPVKAVEEAVPVEAPPPPPPPVVLPKVQPPVAETPPPPPNVDPAPPKVDPVKPAEKPKPKTKLRPHPVVKEKTDAQQASEAHKVGIAEGKAADQGMSKQTYNAILLAQIGQHRVYPEAARAQNVTGLVRVSFTMTASGTASEISIAQSSGNASLDEAARQAVRAVHTPPPPGGPFSTTVGINFTLR